MLVTELEFQQILAQLERHAQVMVFLLVGAGGHFIQRRAAADLAGAGAVLEVVAGHVVIGLAVAAGITNVEHIVGMGGREVAATRIVIAAQEGAHLTLVDARRPRRGELGLDALGDDGATDAVATDADRGDAGKHLQLAQIARIDIGQGRVHVVGAG
ncbi:hypothetical protein D9M68_731420 [compost metagenome]